MSVDWDKMTGLFHKAWGNAASGTYDKSVWKEMHTMFEQAKSEAKASLVVATDEQRKPPHRRTK